MPLIVWTTMVMNAFSLCGISFDRLEKAESSFAQILGIFVKIVDIIDVVMDCIFIRELILLNEVGWAMLMGVAIIMGHLLAICCYSGILDGAYNTYGYGLQYLYYVGTSGCIIFMIEDTTTIYLFADVPEAFHRTYLADMINIGTTLVSAFIVLFLVFVGTIRLLCCGNTSSKKRRGNNNDDSDDEHYIPDLALYTLTQNLALTCNVNIERIIPFILFVKLVCISISVSFFTFVVFNYVLVGKVLEAGTTMSLLTKIVYTTSTIGALLLSIRLPSSRKTGRRSSDNNASNIIDNKEITNNDDYDDEGGIVLQDRTKLVV